MKDVVIVGGGAAGFFSAIRIKEECPDLSVVILEKSADVLQKVKISGGGRCNVTHACFIPKDLAKNYPRGNRELLGPFHKFMTGDIMEWFEERGVPLKIEKDNRVFPQSNSSQSIIDCFMSLCEKYDIQVLKSTAVKNFRQSEGDLWDIETSKGDYQTKHLVLCPGSSKPMWRLLGSMGHKIIDPVPSLFTFNIKDEILEDIPGISVPNARVKINSSKFQTSGPLLITHWGLSGPAVLKLSAIAAIYLKGLNYQFAISVNWLGKDRDEVEEMMQEAQIKHKGSTVVNKSVDPIISKRLWDKILTKSRVSKNKNWGDLSKKDWNQILDVLVNTQLQVDKKSTFKEEFVTAGGVSLKDLDFRSFESKHYKNLYLAGEFIDVDAVTGGFNFQNAWTGGYMIGRTISQKG